MACSVGNPGWGSGLAGLWMKFWELASSGRGQLLQVSEERDKALECRKQKAQAALAHGVLTAAPRLPGPRHNRSLTGPPRALPRRGARLSAATGDPAPAHPGLRPAASVTCAQRQRLRNWDILSR